MAKDKQIAKFREKYDKGKLIVESQTPNIPSVIFINSDECFVGNIQVLLELQWHIIEKHFLLSFIWEKYTLRHYFPTDIKEEKSLTRSMIPTQTKVKCFAFLPIAIGKSFRFNILLNVSILFLKKRNVHIV